MCIIPFLFLSTYIQYNNIIFVIFGRRSPVKMDENEKKGELPKNRLGRTIIRKGDIF